MSIQINQNNSFLLNAYVSTIMSVCLFRLICGPISPAGNDFDETSFTLRLPAVYVVLGQKIILNKIFVLSGRTHRSNQVNAPEYIFLISDLAGERRFASTVAKRLESLGALTHGDRRATETRDLSQFNIDNKYGKFICILLMIDVGRCLSILDIYRMA